MQYPNHYAAIGLLYYPLQQVIFYVRFGKFNTVYSSLDMLLPLVGVLSFLLAFKVLNSAKTTFARVLYWAVFIFLGIPLSLIGSVGGGLLGPIGSIVFGVVPVFVVLYLAKGVLTLLRK